jgi:hypothetical protein
MAKKSPEEFLADLAADPKKLGEFINDPEGAMDKAGIAKKHRPHIKNAIAYGVHRQLASSPEAFSAVKAPGFRRGRST